MKRAGILLAALLFAVPAFAQSPQCIAPQAFLEAVKQRFPSAEVHVLKGREAKVFLAAYNQIPPPTEFAADEIVIAAESKGTAGMKMLLFSNGCLARAGAVPRGVVAPILLSISRAGA
ncbi:MAG: hypothetical protein ACKVP5_11910 [Aestuariivirga sp.]